MGSGNGKGGSTGGNKAHDYYGTIAGAICTGIVDAILSIVIDNKEAWPAAKPWQSGKPYAVNDLRSWGGRTWRCILGHTSGNGNVPPSNLYWVQYVLSRGASIYTDVTIESFGVARIYWGTDSQTAHPKFQSSGNEFGEDHPDYKGVCYIVLQDFLFGRERTSAPNLEVIVQRKPQQSIVTGTNANTSDGQVNMMAAVAELLTHWNGLAMDPAGIDATSFNAVATYLGNNAALTACAPLLDNQVTVREFMQGLEELTDAFVRFNPSTKLIEAGYYPHGTVPSSPVTLTIDDLTERSRFTPKGWANAYSLAVVQFNDRTRSFKRTSDRVPDPRAFRVLQEIRALTLDRPFITRRSQAVQHAAETIRTKGQPQLGGVVTVRREKARTILPGGYVLVDIDLEPGGAVILQYFRVKQREVPPFGPIRLTLEADVTLAAIPFGAEDISTAELPLDVPALENFRIIESPVLLADGRTNNVLVLAQRPGPTISGFQVYFDSDTEGTFQIVGNLRGFACRATLRADYGASDTSALQINVPSQVDSDILAETVSDLKAKDDQLLAILVKIDPGRVLPPFLPFLFPRSLSSDQATSSQVAEDDGGYSEIEICSISAINLVSAGNYNLTMLRARRATKLRSFGTSDCEVWIVRRNSLDAIEHLRFSEVRSNRIAGVMPDTGYFRLVPYTALDSRELVDCASAPFLFPVASSAGPTLVLTTPATRIQYPPAWATGVNYVINDIIWFGGQAHKSLTNHTSSASNRPPNATNWTSGVSVPYPASFDFAGTWTDPNNDMVATQIIIEKDNGYSAIVDDDSFTPIGTAEIDETVKLPENGNWSVRLIAVDATGLRSERVVRITALGSAHKCADPKFYFHGKKLPGTEWNLYGKMKLKCATPGASISFRYLMRSNIDDSIGHTSAFFTYDESNASWDKRPNGVGDGGLNVYVQIEAFATKAGYTSSATTVLTLKSKSVDTT